MNHWLLKVPSQISITIVFCFLTHVQFNIKYKLDCIRFSSTKIYRFSLKLKGNVILTNPWTTFQHLDVSDRWHPYIILSTMVIYIIFTFVWITICYLNRQYFIIHHKFLTVLLIIRILEYLVFYVSFVMYNSTGISTDVDLLLYNIIHDVYEIISLIFLMLVSLGYYLYRTQINIRQLRVGVCSLILYCFVCLFTNVCFLFENYCQFLKLFQFILRCFLLVGIIALLNSLVSSVNALIRIEPWKNDLLHSYLLLKSHKFWFYLCFVLFCIS